MLFAHGESHSKWVAILFNKNLKVVFGSKYVDSSNRIFLTESQIEEIKLLLLQFMHLPKMIQNFLMMSFQHF